MILPLAYGLAFADWYALQDEEMKERCRRVFPSVTAKLDEEQAVT